MQDVDAMFRTTITQLRLKFRKGHTMGRSGNNLILGKKGCREKQQEKTQVDITGRTALKGMPEGVRASSGSGTRQNEKASQPHSTRKRRLEPYGEEVALGATSYIICFFVTRVLSSLLPAARAGLKTEWEKLHGFLQR